jgi:hypothetical protein
MVSIVPVMVRIAWVISPMLPVMFAHVFVEIRSMSVTIRPKFWFISIMRVGQGVDLPGHAVDHPGEQRHHHHDQERGDDDEPPLVARRYMAPPI